MTSWNNLFFDVSYTGLYAKSRKLCYRLYPFLQAKCMHTAAGVFQCVVVDTIYTNFIMVMTCFFLLTEHNSNSTFLSSAITKSDMKDYNIIIYVNIFTKITHGSLQIKVSTCVKYYKNVTDYTKKIQRGITYQDDIPYKPHRSCVWHKLKLYHQDNIQIKGTVGTCWLVFPLNETPN